MRPYTMPENSDTSLGQFKTGHSTSRKLASPDSLGYQPRVRTECRVSDDMHKVSMTCFGVGDGAACPDRNHSSFLYQFSKTSLLFDCGEPISGSFKASGLDYDSIDRIFISHLHADHIGGFFMLIQGFWLARRRKDLIVNMPEEGIQPMRQMLNASCIFEELLGFRLIYQPLKPRQAEEINGVRVTPFLTTHLDTLRETFQSKYPQAFEAYCFLLEAGRLRIGHSADLGAPDDLDPLLEKPLDLLVCELAHFKREDMFRYLKGREIQRIVFTHVSRSYWEQLEETRRLATQMLGGMSFSFAHDQEVITLPEG